MLAELVNTLWMRSLIGGVVAYGLLLAGLIVAACLLRRASKRPAPSDPMAEVVGVLGVPESYTPRHYALPTQRVGGVR